MLGSNGLGIDNFSSDNTLFHGYYDAVEKAFDNYSITPEKKDLAQAYEELFSYPLRFADEIGYRLDRYNGAERINTFTIKSSGRVKDPSRFHKVLEFCREMSSIYPSHGIRTNPDRKGSDSINIPVLIEFPNGNSIGVFYFDEKRSIAFNKIQKVEKALVDANLSGGIIVYNIYGFQAERELKRINEIHGNDKFLTMFRYSEIANYKSSLK